MRATNNLEIEIKLPMRGALAPFRKKLRLLGFEVLKQRAFESNVLFDMDDLRLRKAKELIRVRRVGREGLLTYKGPPEPGKHKKREELESGVEDAGTVEAILGRLGLKPVFRYEKYRTEYRKPKAPGTLTLDETPIGNYIELEGPPAWIDKTAKLLGYREDEYITLSYGRLYQTYCREHGIEPTHMLFKQHP